jgi:predicted transcriptional regulator
MAGKEKPISVDVFLREKPAKILLALKTREGSVYVTMLSKEADCTYSHVIKILNIFHDLGLVKFEKSGRIKKVNLTEEGWGVANKMDSVLKNLLKLKLEKPEAKKAKKK